MKTISNKETALMVLLSEAPMHAYKIEQAIVNRSMREWTEISTSSIYKLLRKLEDQSLITSKIEISKNNIAQKIYSMTSRGQDILKEKIYSIISEPENIKYRIDLATSHLGLLPIEEALKGLTTYRTKLQENLKGYKALEEYLISQKCPKHSLALARRPQQLIEADIQWVTEYIKDLSRDKG